MLMPAKMAEASVLSYSKNTMTNGVLARITVNHLKQRKDSGLPQNLKPMAWFVQPATGIDTYKMVMCGQQL
jgi:hypothetical protein